MESSTSDGLFKQINNLYNKSSFLEKYGLDVWTVIIVCLIFFSLSSYFYILNNIEPIKADWENQRCNPAVMPFAGFINKGANESNLEFTGKNFTGCVQSILTNIIAYAFQPIYYIMKTLIGSLSELVTSMNSMRAMFDKIRISIKDFSTETMGRTLNITMPIVQFIITIKDMGAKMIGTLTASIFTLYGSYLTLQSFFAFTLELLTIILIALAATIAGLIIANVFAFGALSGVIALNTAIMIAILIPTVMVQIFMSDVLKLSSKSLPSVPSCFSGHTLIELDCDDSNSNSNSNKKTIEDIEIGDVLKGGEIVTAVMKFSSKDQDIYELKGTIVTGEHCVWHNTLGWIKVKNHPDSLFIIDFEEPFVYCIGTDEKTFTINGQLYSDWDDIDKKVYKCLHRFCSEIYSYKDIHTYLDNGIVGSSLVKLKTGESIPIVDVKVDDLLANDVKVLGLIKIDATDIRGVYDYTYLNKTISGFNVNVCLGKIEIETYGIGIETNEIDANEIDANEIEDHREKYLYQLLTDKGYFIVNDITIRDYNYGIDKYIEWSKSLHNAYNA